MKNAAVKVAENEADMKSSDRDFSSFLFIYLFFFNHPGLRAIMEGCGFFLFFSFSFSPPTLLCCQLHLTCDYK